MSTLFLILLVGMPFSAFLIPSLNIWHVHGLWFWLWSLVLLGTSIFKEDKYSTINIPFGLLTLWFGLITLFFAGRLLVVHQIFASRLIFPFFNFMLIVLFYKFVVSYLNRDDIERIIKYLTISVFLVLCYCVLQIFNLDQFYRGAAMLPNDNSFDYLVGTIGNSHHLSGYLAICLPLFLYKKCILSRLGLYLTFGILGATGSATGLFTAVCVTGFISLFSRRLDWKDILVLVSMAVAFFGIKYQFNFKELISLYGCPSGRIEIWKLLIEDFRKAPITGTGLGTFSIMTEKAGLEPWRHAHSEYLQILKEAGLIGLGLVIFCITAFFKRLKRDLLSITLGGMFLGFTLVCLLSYPAHLWLLASMGIFGYAGAIALQD